MNKILLIIAVLFSFTVNAQVKKVTIQASGLTCSTCSNSIFKALKTLDFVDHVDTDLKSSSFDITFNTSTRIDFDKLKKKVEDAGFFVANFTVIILVENLAISNDTHVDVGNDIFHFLNVKDKILSGDQTIRILDKGFVSSKEFKKNSSLTKMACYKSREENGKRIFHVTI